MGDKARSVIEVKSSHQAVVENALVEATQEQGGAFRGANHHVECDTGGVIEAKKSHSFASGSPGPEVFAVAKGQVHAVGIGKAAGGGIGKSLAAVSRDPSLAQPPPHGDCGH